MTDRRRTLVDEQAGKKGRDSCLLWDKKRFPFPFSDALLSAVSLPDYLGGAA